MLFIACKSNTIEDFCGEVARAGFSVDTINAATILDYNAIQYAYPTLDEDVLLINIGARSTNLLFKNPDGFFVRISNSVETHLPRILQIASVSLSLRQMS